MTDTGRQPSPEELQAYLEQMRQADAAGLIAEAYNLLAAGAQVKLGRPDARTLIDAMAALTQATGSKLPNELATQMQEGVTQLQLAQVESERQEQAGAEAASESAESPAADTSQQSAGQRMTDRLWIPGRDPQPPRS